MKNLDFNKIRAGVLLPTAVGFIVIVVGFLFGLLLGFLSFIDIVRTVLDFMISWGNLILSLVGFVLFFLLFFWAGYRTARKYRGELVEAGVAGALSYAILAVVSVFFDMVNGFLQMLELMDTSAVGGISLNAYEDVAIAIFGDTFAGATEIIAVLCCGFAAIPIGAVLNFLVGSVGGMLGSPEKKKE
jgi:hypothetical protein